MTYTLLVNNAGPDTATGVLVTDTLDASLTFKSSASGCTAAAPPVVSCNVADIACGGHAQTVTFVATIGASVAAGTVDHEHGHRDHDDTRIESRQQHVH